MIRKEVILFFGILLMLAGFFFILNTVQAAQTSVCCEKATSGAWCQESPPATCASGFREAPTSCEATSYCRLGTCVDSKEGTCLENTPERVCDANQGEWYNQKSDDLPQCQLGCCFIGESTSFVTQTRCKSLASLYGTNTTFNSNIKTEVECIANANPSEEGACVLNTPGERNCRRLTRAECLPLERGDTTIEFKPGSLCSDENLATICGRSEQTACFPDKDGVYFVDTCGNRANIYDKSKIDDEEYWSKIIDESEACNPDESNANSASCGNCNYFAGSVCKAYQRGNNQTPTKPSYGDFVCADLSCKWNGETYKHQETWCANPSGIAEGLPGSENARMVCYDGEVTVEPCASYRQEVCIETTFDTTEGDFKAAQCRTNLWRECASMDNKKDCENRDVRDCKWIEGESILRDGEGKFLVVNEDGELVQEGEGKKIQIGTRNIAGITTPIYKEMGAACVPLYSPGFDFWNPDGEAGELCAIASDNCVVKFTHGVLGDFGCKENCECLGLKEGDNPDKATENNAWAKNRTTMCIALGDCGAKNNYAGLPGYNKIEDLVTITKNLEKNSSE